MSILITVIIFIVVLGLLIFVHELGHFLIAKRAGVRVEEFGFGYPPRLFSIKRGETRYSLNLIPVGGFVRLYGEDGKETKNSRSFAAKRPRTRAAILVAGVVGNLIFAVILFGIISQIGTPTAVADDVVADGRVRNPQIQVTAVASDSPAAESGIKLGDTIVAINNTPVNRVTDVQEQTATQAGEELALTLARGETQRSVTLTPRLDHPEDEGPLGVALARVALIKAPWYAAPWEGVRLTVTATGQILNAFGNLIVDIFRGQGGAEGVVGVVGIAVVTGQFSELGASFFLQFVALLSINLAILNILPFPALDGGRLLFLGIEVLRGRKVSPRVESAVHAIGFALLMLVFVAITVSDVVRFSLLERIRSLFS